MRQLTRIAVTGAAGSPDEQDAKPDEGGSYGELVEEIDRLLATQADGQDPSTT